MQRSASNSALSSGVRPEKMICLKATGRPDKMETVAKLPLPITTSFHSGLISCEAVLSDAVVQYMGAFSVNVAGKLRSM